MIKLKKIINEFIKYEQNIYKLKRGEGEWYFITKNGIVIYEGNKKYIQNILKKITNYNYKKIKQILDDSLTNWIEFKIK